MWEGVSLDTLLNEIADDAAFALVRFFGGYTMNLPLVDPLDGQAWVAFTFDVEGPRMDSIGVIATITHAILAVRIRS